PIWQSRPGNALARSRRHFECSHCGVGKPCPAGTRPQQAARPRKTRPPAPTSRSALENTPLSPQNVLIDHLGDIRQSLKLGLPIYRVRGSAGYVWSAASDEAGRGHLRFLAVDAAAL